MAMNVVIDMLKNRNSAMRVNNGEGRGRHTAGFTMAEMLIVVAIIGVLAGVSFIAVQTHQRSMTQLQYDAIAKEIFVAAQNHLTLAKSENYQQKADLSAAINNGFFGTKGTAEADTNDDIYYFTSTSSNVGTALDQILPLGAVELVTGGKYIIRYQPNAARVLDVFYWTDDDKYGIESMDYTTAVDSYSGTDKKGDREKIGGNGVLGWCGGEGVVESGKYLEAPEIEVINAEMLLVTVTNPNTDKDDLSPQLKLIVTGNQSKAKIAIPLDDQNSFQELSSGERVVYDPVDKIFTIVLDDITTESLHFSELQKEKKIPAGTLKIGAFIPGENITIQAVAYSNSVLASVAYSGEWTTNSLFGEVTEDETGKRITKISNIRHLANLNDSLSGLEYNKDYFSDTINAVQMTNLYWNDTEIKTDDFVSAIKTRKSVEEVRIYIGTSATKADCFLPVSVNYTLNYNGQSNVEISETTGTGENAETTTNTFTENHSIKGIVVDNTDAPEGSVTVASGGVFGSLTGGEIRNLELIDTKVTLASDDAGALAGTLENTEVENVIAYNSTAATAANITTAASGSAGGLIGSAKNCIIEKSAAALIVSSSGGNAGGLIGTASGGTVSACYSGGQAIDDPDGTGVVIYSDEKFNVTAAAGNAGGLIGDAGAAAISNSYSTCSVAGKYAGGFVGKGDTGGSASNSYATGLVLGGDTTTKTVTGEDGKTTTETTFTEIEAQEGAFAYAFDGTVKNCQFFEIVNERDEKDETGAPTGGYTYLLPIPNDTSGTIKALDESAESYNVFCGAATDWKPAIPYKQQTMLEAYYGGKYNLKTVEQLAGSLKTDEDDATVYFVATHYGDWPAPEIFVVNE